MMNEFVGKVAFPGIAIGQIVELKKKSNIVERTRVGQVETEVERFYAAKVSAEKQLLELYTKAQQEVGEANAAIFEVHQMMLGDGDYEESVLNIIRQQEVNAEYAVAITGDNFSQVFASMEDEYMKERAVDVKDISERLVRILQNIDDHKKELPEHCIIVADDLTPSETVQLDKDKVIAFVTRYGSTNSHTAILARAMNIPALIRAAVPSDLDGKQAIVDGIKGSITIDPDSATLSEAEDLLAKEVEKREMLQKMKGKASETKSGKIIRLYANIGGVSDLGSVLQNDGEGIGLFRSEFLYLEKSDYPTEEEQFQVYKQVAETMARKKVIIRTLDIGADKQIDYFKLQTEENPALGYRAIRICLTREDIFKTQLRAIYRASVFGNIGIMIPMIISVWEVKKVKEIIAKVKEELTADGIPYGEVEFGIMIETPAAVMIAEELAREVEFFSVGTNDLTQYTLAIDRQNAELDRFYDAHHPAVLRMIEQIIEGGHKAGIWVGICGELGADLQLTEKFIEMGVDELSVSPAMILPVRKKIREVE